MGHLFRSPGLSADEAEADPIRPLPGVPIHTLKPSQLLGPYHRLSEVAGGATAWRYPVRRGDENWYVDFRLSVSGPVFNQLVGGRAAARFMIAGAFAQISAPEGASLRILRLPTARFQALWLAGEEDLFIDLAFSGKPSLSGPELLKTMLCEPGDSRAR
jgi:hypothetical protein